MPSFSLISCFLPPCTRRDHLNDSPSDKILKEALKYLFPPGEVYMVLYAELLRNAFSFSFATLSDGIHNQM